MNIDVDLEVKIYPNALKGIIAEYLNEIGYEACADDVEIVVGQRTEGYGPGEREVYYLDKIVVPVTRKEI